MTLGGLWHGAAWTFVIWGALHGFYLLVNHAFRRLRGRSRPRSAGGALCSWAFTFLAVVVAWVFFRASDADAAVRLLGGMAGMNGFVSIHTAPVIDPAALLHRYGLTVPGEIIPGFVPRLAIIWVAVGLGIALFFPNTQQIFRLPFEPPIPHLADRQRKPPYSRPLLLRSLHWRPSLRWAVACALLYAGSIIWMSGTTRFLYFQF
jgi:hypothetical protein